MNYIGAFYYDEHFTKVYVARGRAFLSQIYHFKFSCQNMAPHDHVTYFYIALVTYTLISVQCRNGSPFHTCIICYVPITNNKNKSQVHELSKCTSYIQFTVYSFIRHTRHNTCLWPFTNSNTNMAKTTIYIYHIHSSYKHTQI